MRDNFWGLNTMNIINKVLVSALLAVIGISGCTNSLSPDTYTTSTAGQLNRVVPGVVVSSRVVEVADDANAGDGGMAGTLGGAALGGIAGSSIGHGRGSALGLVGGAILGGIAGNAMQKQITQQTGIEYVIRTKQGMISVVQGPTPTFNRGQHVLIQYGRRVRVIADPDFAR